MEDEKELIVIGLNWLSDNIHFRDIYTNTNDKPTTQAPAVEYSNNEMRVIRRVKDFIDRSDENLQWFHDLLAQNKLQLNKDVFKVFYKVWSNIHKEKHPKEVTGVIRIKNPNIDWTEVALDELNK